MSEERIDDSGPRVVYSPADAWEAGYICDTCRGMNQTEAIKEVAWNGSWMTALATVPVSNITLSFRGTEATAYFILFTSVGAPTNVGLPSENKANIVFYLNNTRVDPSPIQYDYWWYPDFPQEDFLPDMILFWQQNLGPYTHNLTISYTIDPGRAPQVYLAFDRLAYIPVSGAQPGPGSSISRTTTSPSQTSQMPETTAPPSSSSNDPPPAGGSTGGSSDTNTSRILGLSIGLSLLGGFVVAGLLFWFYKARKTRFVRDDSYDAKRQRLSASAGSVGGGSGYGGGGVAGLAGGRGGRAGNFSPPPPSADSTLPVLSPFYTTDQHTASEHSSSPVTSRGAGFDVIGGGGGYHRDQRDSPRSGSSHQLPPTPFANEKSFLRMGNSRSSEPLNTSPLNRPSGAPHSVAGSSSAPTSSGTPPPVPPKGGEKVRLRWLTTTNGNEDDLISLNEMGAQRRPEGEFGRYGMTSGQRPLSERPPSYTSDPGY